MITFPRELHIWLQHLNLTYKITNPKRDLSNGWLIAEIFSRYPYKSGDNIEMYQYDNGFKLDKKQNNWEHLNKYFKKHNIPIEPKDYDPVIHCAPDAAYNLLKKIYKILTSREVDDTLQPIQQQHMMDNADPDYAKPTIAKKLKDHEIDRIADSKRMTEKAKVVITQHNDMLRTERMNPDRYTKTKTGFAAVKHQEIATAKVLSQQLKKKQLGKTDTSNADVPPPGESKPIQVKTANKSIRVMKQEANQKLNNQNKLPGGIQDEDSDELVLENILVDIVGQTLVNKMSKSDPEYKNLKENYDKVLPYFQDRFKFIADDLILDIFVELSNRQEEIVNVVSRNMVDICDFFKFFNNALKQTNPTATINGDVNESEEQPDPTKGQNIFNQIVQTFSQIGNKLLNEDPIQTEIYFLEYGLEDLLEIITDNDFKRNEMIFLLYCFVQNTTNSHLRVLNKIREKICASKKNQYYSILSKVLVYENEQLPEEIFNFYLRDATQGIYQISPITRTKCVSILSYFSRLRLEVVLPLMPILAKQSKEQYWELQGQLLILCSNALLYFNTETEGNQDDKIDETQNENSVVDGEETKLKNESLVKGKPVISEEIIDQYTPLIFDIIQTILTNSAPKVTIKIGLIYLAKILHFYPEYTRTYLDILLNAPDQIRQSVLEVEPLPGTEEEVYVSGPNTEKYRTFGAPHEWNSLYIAQALEKYIISHNLENLEQSHIEIFEACLEQEFKDEEIDQWLQIFSSLKNYFFISLCYRDFSNSSIEILKKFFCQPLMQPNILKECLDIFIKTLQLLYQPDCDNDCKENAREFLEFLHDNPESTQGLKDFVYNSIKYFAEGNQKSYHSSNLIELMNGVVEARRGEIFDDGVSMLTGGSEYGQMDERQLTHSSTGAKVVGSASHRRSIK